MLVNPPFSGDKLHDLSFPDPLCDLASDLVGDPEFRWLLVLMFSSDILGADRLLLHDEPPIEFVF